MAVEMGVGAGMGGEGANVEAVEEKLDAGGARNDDDGATPGDPVPNWEGEGERGGAAALDTPPPLIHCDAAACFESPSPATGVSPSLRTGASPMGAVALPADVADLRTAKWNRRPGLEGPPTSVLSSGSALVDCAQTRSCADAGNDAELHPTRQSLPRPPRPLRTFFSYDDIRRVLCASIPYHNGRQRRPRGANNAEELTVPRPPFPLPIPPPVRKHVE
jgi:hypothetical protein